MKWAQMVPVTDDNWFMGWFDPVASQAVELGLDGWVPNE